MYCWFTEFCENLLSSAGVRFAGPIAILRNWTFCLFYVMAELWGSVVVSLLFWGFANQVSVRSFLPLLYTSLAYAVVCVFTVVLLVQITTVDEAKTFYPLFGLGANVALIFSGRAVKYFSQVKAITVTQK